MNYTSIAAQVILTVIPIVGIVFGCAVVFFYIYYNHRVKMLMIEKGIYQKPAEKFDLDSFSLLVGLITFGIGLAMSVFFVLREGVSYGLLGGLIPLAVGGGLIAFFIVRMKMNKRRDG
jgi:hypothetical protein